MIMVRPIRNVRQMLRAIDEAFGNYAVARERYREWLQSQRQYRGTVPDRREFERLDQRFGNGEAVMNFINVHRGAGRPRIHWRREEQVIALARAYPAMGLRRIARRVGISHMTMRRIIREEGLRPFRLQRVQALHHGDRAVRKNFCRWMLRKLDRNPRFLQNVLFTDESSFSNSALQNSQNTRIWAIRNPHAMIQRFNQGRFSVNVWAGILGDRIIGPVYLPSPLTSVNYLQFLRTDLLNALRQIVPTEVRRRIYFMHDGVPPHYGRPVRLFLNQMFRTRFIGRRPAPHLWPPRSPDLNPLDFFLWGAAKDLVYRSGQHIRNVQELRNKIDQAFGQLQTTPNLYQRIRRNMIARLQACIENNGGHIEVGVQARMLRALDYNGAVLWVRRRNRRRRNRQQN